MSKQHKSKKANNTYNYNNKKNYIDIGFYISKQIQINANYIVEFDIRVKSYNTEEQHMPLSTMVLFEQIGQYYMKEVQDIVDKNEILNFTASVDMTSLRLTALLNNKVTTSDDTHKRYEELVFNFFQYICDIKNVEQIKKILKTNNINKADFDFVKMTAANMFIMRDLWSMYKYSYNDNSDFKTKDVVIVKDNKLRKQQYLINPTNTIIIDASTGKPATDKQLDTLSIVKNKVSSVVKKVIKKTKKKAEDNPSSATESALF